MNVIKSKRLMAYYGVILMMLCMVFLVLFKDNAFADQLLKGANGTYTTYYHKVWKGDEDNKQYRPDEVKLTVTLEREKTVTQDTDEEDDSDEGEDSTSTRSTARAKSKRNKTRKETVKVTETKEVTIPKSDSDTWKYIGKIPVDSADNNIEVTEDKIPGYKPEYGEPIVNKGSGRVDITVTNIWTTGDLIIKKEVVGEGESDKDKEFKFTVSVWDESSSDIVLNGVFGDLTFVNGIAEFTLKDGESVKAVGLPINLKYEVTEENSEGYTVRFDNDKGTIVEGETTASFTNISGGNNGGGGNGGGGGGKNFIDNETPAPKPEIPADNPVTPGNEPPTPWYKLPVMGDEQFGPGFVNDNENKVSLPEDSNEQETIIPQLAKLYAENNELAGWLTVPGTEFGYPVMLSPSDPYYYQHHTFDKKLDDIGIPFMGPYCTKDSMNILIHGHNMRDVSQFGYIWNYQYPEFLKENPVIDFKTLTDANGSYEVMAVFFAPEYAEGTENVFWWYRYIGDMNKEQFDYFVQNAKALSLYDTGVTAEYGDKLITLETCASSKDSTRLVVVARKSNE